MTPPPLPSLTVLYSLLVGPAARSRKCARQLIGRPEPRML